MKKKIIIVLTLLICYAFFKAGISESTGQLPQTIDTKLIWNSCAAFKVDTAYFVEEREPSKLLLHITVDLHKNFIGCPVGSVEIYDYFNPIYNHSEIKQ